MKLNVKFQNNWFVIPVKNDNENIDYLIKETIQRYLFNLKEKRKQMQTDLNSPVHKGDQNGNGQSNKLMNGDHTIDIEQFNKLNEEVIEIRKNATNAILNKIDIIAEVLQDDDFICIVLKSDLEDYYQDRTIEKLHTMVLNLELNKNDDKKKTFYLDGNTLKPEDLYELGLGCHKIDLTESAWNKVREGRKLLDDLIKDNRVVYGINTGFGRFASTLIDKSDLKQLQVNLIRSHASGVGKPLNLVRTRRLFALRINVLAKGYSGISAETLKCVVDAFNADCLSWVPEQGTVGASGDLAPLSHLALGLIGEGKMYSPLTGYANAKIVLEHNNLKPIELKPKEGIAMINGTQLITSLTGEAVINARRVTRQADIIAAITLEVLKGTTRAFDKWVHDLRPHPGQSLVAETLRSLLHSEIFKSEIAESHRFCQRVQDAYTIRCVPQVNGVVHQTIDFVYGIIQTEMNSATDNPLVIPEIGECISGGNFHGEFPAKAADYLAIAVHELGNISERRIDRLMNTSLSGLPMFLINDGGLQSGLMMMHCSSAALVSENKVLCHPASVDSISTSAGTEDHVSMGGYAARKVLQVVENVERVLAMELLAALQALEFLRPLKSTEPIEAIYDLVREHVLPLDKDRFLAPEVEKVYQLLKQNAIYNTAKPYMDTYKRKIKTIKKKISIAERKSRPSSPTAFLSETYLAQRTDLNADTDNSDT